MDGQVTLAVAFAAGTVSFVSPCVLPLVPAYVTNLAGVSMTADEAGAGPRRLTALAHALAFVAGFTVVFVAFWTSIGLMGFVVVNHLPYIRIASGVVLVFMGFHVMGVWRLPFLEREARAGFSLKGRASYPRSFLLGLAFAAGWTPCIGPVLSAIIGLATTEATAWKGGYLLLAYSLGLGIPFLATALALGTVTRALRGVRRYQRAIEVVTGLFIVAVGVLMMTNMFVTIPRYFNWAAR